MTRNNSTIDRSVEYTSRRNFLLAAGAVGTAAGVGGIAAAQDTEDEPDETFRLTADADYWIGNEPASINGEKNPTLELEAGNTYRVVWENGDGESHNFAIYSQQGNLLVHSPFLDNKGVTQTVEFTAVEGMVDYYCEVHYLSMRGDVEVSGETDEELEPVTADYFSDGPSVALETVAEGFSYPADFAIADEEADRRFIVDQTGQIYVHDEDGLQDEPFLDISDRLVQEKGPHPEVGLLGLAFHPDFEDTGKFYLRYSAPIREGTPQEYDHTEVLSEFQATDDLSQGDPDSERTLIEFPSPQSNHNSGNVLFGPDDYLYVTMGDGGFGGDHGGMLGHVTGGNGQDVTQNLLGGIHRIDVDNEEDGKPYAIPDDNPLVGDADGLDEYYSWGWRNPWGTSFDSEGRLFAADVGRSLFEEVNLVENGGNYGWNIKEGTHCFDEWHHANPPKECADTGYPPRNDELIDPIIEYPHFYEGKPVGQAVTGGHVYEGDEVSKLQGEYVFGDWSFSPIEPHGTLLAGSPPEDGDGRWLVEKLPVVGDDGRPDGRVNRFISAFGEGRDGELYVLTSETFLREENQGAVHKLVSAEAEQETPTEKATPTETPTPTDSD